MSNTGWQREARKGSQVCAVGRAMSGPATVPNGLHTSSDSGESIAVRTPIKKGMFAAGGRTNATEARFHLLPLSCRHVSFSFCILANIGVTSQHISRWRVDYFLQGPQSHSQIIFPQKRHPGSTEGAVSEEISMGGTSIVKFLQIPLALRRF